MLTDKRASLPTENDPSRSFRRTEKAGSSPMSLPLRGFRRLRVPLGLVASVLVLLNLTFHGVKKCTPQRTIGFPDDFNAILRQTSITTETRTDNHLGLIVVYVPRQVRVPGRLPEGLSRSPS